MTDIKFTIKQIEILKVIKALRDDGDHCDVYDIMDKLTYAVKRDALRHSIKILVDAGLVQTLPKVKRGSKMHTPFMVTASGSAAI